MHRPSCNNRKPYHASALLLFALSVASTAALAHPGHGDEGGFLAGFNHPFTGLDHLLVMLGVGLWSAMSVKRAWPDLLWAPLGFVAVLLVGVALGMVGVTLPLVEPAIALSVVAIGLLIALRTRMPAFAAAMVVGVFAIFHGLVHGQGFAGSHDAGAAVLGLTLATILLHLVGVALGWALRSQQRPALPRFAGSAIAVAGVLVLGGILG